MRPSEPGEPDMRPLGGIALGLAALSALFAMSGFFSPFAYLAAAIAIPLGLMARGHERSHVMGTAAVVVAAIAVVGATAILLAFT